jgi:hypothetical protein
MESVDELIRQIVENGAQPDFYGPQKHESVERLQGLLGVAFPPSYRRFLETYGGGYGMTGLLGNEPESIHLGCLLGDTQRLRERHQLPAHFLPVRVSPLGGIDALDTSSPDAAGECPVYLLTIGPNGRLTHTVKTADSFDAFLRGLLADRLEVLLEEQDEE